MNLLLLWINKNSRYIDHHVRSIDRVTEPWRGIHSSSIRTPIERDLGADAAVYAPFDYAEPSFTHCAAECTFHKTTRHNHKLYWDVSQYQTELVKAMNSNDRMTKGISRFRSSTVDNRDYYNWQLFLVAAPWFIIGLHWKKRRLKKISDATMECWLRRRFTYNGMKMEITLGGNVGTTLISV